MHWTAATGYGWLVAGGVRKPSLTIRARNGGFFPRSGPIQQVPFQSNRSPCRPRLYSGGSGSGARCSSRPRCRPSACQHPCMPGNGRSCGGFFRLQTRRLPYAAGATGNVATEDVLYRLTGLGIEIGVDMGRLLTVGALIDTALERQPASRLGRIPAGTLSFGENPHRAGTQQQARRPQAAGTLCPRSSYAP